MCPKEANVPEIDPHLPAIPPRLEIDLDAYLPLFEDDDISEADKRALLEALWSIMMSFIQIGWGVHPVQQAQASRALREITCGKLDNGFADDRTPNPLMIESLHQSLREQFDSVAGVSPQKVSDS